METYEEVMRRSGPKNYTVRWVLVDGTTEQAVYFTDYHQAEVYASTVRSRNLVRSVLILRSGRHPSAKQWVSHRQIKRKNPLTNSGLNEDVWTLPEGYVDGDADKYGPVVVMKTENRMPARSNTEKAEWARNNSFNSKTCLWQ